MTCFEILDDAIEIDNSLPFAFQAGVFSSDIGPSLRAAQQLDPSAVMIDDHSASTGRLSPGAACRVFICGASIAREKGWNGCQGGRQDTVQHQDETVIPRALAADELDSQLLDY